MTVVAGVTLDDVLRYTALGLCVIPLKPCSKKPALQGWTTARVDIEEWFGNGQPRNAGIVLGRPSGVVVIESDTAEAETWCAGHLPSSPMMTGSARGFHRYYRLPTGRLADIDIPGSFTTADGITIEIKREGQYVVAPGSVHPSGHVYAEVAPWPTDLADVPEFPVRAIFDAATPTRSTTKPLPNVVGAGERNDGLYREGCRLRRLGWNQGEIAKALLVLNGERCRPPLDAREVEGIAASCAKHQPAADTFPLTEAGDAEYFAACFGDSVRFDHRAGRWLLFSGHLWLPQTDGEVDRLALDAVRARQAAALRETDTAKRQARLKWATGGEQVKRRRALLDWASSLRPITDDGANWNADLWLLGVENGVLDLRTGTVRAGRPEDRITLRVRAPFVASATCPLWDRTIHEIFNGDAELIAYFDRYIGYSLTGDCREETLALCWGGGANGKGTVMNTVGWLLGDYADDLPFSALELHERSGIPNDIAKIVGKRFVTSSESGETRRLNEARVKALTGRDPITARFLHREFFTFQPVAKFWLATNHKPTVRDTSVGFWRRIHLIPFTQSFAERPDLTLKDRLRAEAAGILARAVRGCLAWQREGLNPPAVVRQATDRYRTESEPLEQFFDACCVRKPGASATFGELFQAYIRYCGETRLFSRLTRREFGDALQERFAVDHGDRRYVRYQGVGLFSYLGEEEADVVDRELPEM